MTELAIKGLPHGPFHEFFVQASTSCFFKSLFWNFNCSCAGTCFIYLNFIMFQIFWCAMCSGQHCQNCKLSEKFLAHAQRNAAWGQPNCGSAVWPESQLNHQLSEATKVKDQKTTTCCHATFATPSHTHTHTHIEKQLNNLTFPREHSLSNFYFYFLRVRRETFPGKACVRILTWAARRRG
jgi:hypothetical protein